MGYFCQLALENFLRRPYLRSYGEEAPQPVLTQAGSGPAKVLQASRQLAASSPN